MNAPLRPDSRSIVLAGSTAVVTIAASAVVDVLRSTTAHGPARHLDIGGIALLAMASGVLAWWRRLPVVTLFVAFAGVVTYDRIGYPRGPAYLPLIIATFAAILQGRRWAAYGVLAAGYLISVRPLLGGSSLSSQVGLAGWLLIIAAAAELTRIRARARRAEADRAEQAVKAEAESIRRHAGEQRLRIAQDLHDVLGHQLALITIQANAGLRLIHHDRQAAETAFRAIRDAGNLALGDLQSALDILRTGTSEPRHPVPRMTESNDVNALVDGARRAGLEVSLDLTGSARAVPFAVDQAAYRIIQEAITNAIRHAGPGTRVRVGTQCTDTHLMVRIEDDGSGAPAAAPTTGSGIGLIGMRERVEALGGRLEAGPNPAGGFTVEACLPTGAPR